MPILHPFTGSIQEYEEAIADPSRYRPDHCPQCQAAQGLTAHGFYRRSLVDAGFDGWIRVRRYLCRCCKRTVSLLPQFALPYLLRDHGGRAILSRPSAMRPHPERRRGGG